MILVSMVVISASSRPLAGNRDSEVTAFSESRPAFWLSCLTTTYAVLKPGDLWMHMLPPAEGVLVSVAFSPRRRRAIDTSMVRPVI